MKMATYWIYTKFIRPNGQSLRRSSKADLVRTGNLSASNKHSKLIESLDTQCRNRYLKLKTALKVRTSVIMLHKILNWIHPSICRNIGLRPRMPYCSRIESKKCLGNRQVVARDLMAKEHVPQYASVARSNVCYCVTRYQSAWRPFRKRKTPTVAILSYARCVTQLWLASTLITKRSG